MKIKKTAVKAALKPIETTPANCVTTPVTGVKTSTNGVKTHTPAVLTTIDVKMDVGFGNAVFLRGQGAGLTWDQGVPLICVDGKTWRWSSEVKDPIKFKLLINDKIWSAGSDLTVVPGQKIEIAPAFAL